jgi:hypothetical protein
MSPIEIRELADHTALFGHKKAAKVLHALADIAEQVIDDHPVLCDSPNCVYCNSLKKLEEIKPR